MKRSSFAATLLASLSFQGTSAALTSYQLPNDWLVEYEASSCGLRISKHVEGQGVSRVPVFESDARLLTVGHGDVDDITIMVAGNVDNFPKVQTRSSVMACGDGLLDNASGSFTFGGSIVLDDANGSTTDFNVAFNSTDANRLSFTAHAKDAFSATNGTNFVSLTYNSPADEEIYGMGLQYSEWDFKGKSVPLISTEAGVGRGL